MAETYENIQSWLAQAGPELAGAEAAWASGNAGRGRVGARRAAGMGLKAWLCAAARPGYGKSFMDHLGALADDPEIPVAVREAAWRLSARPVPEGGFAVPIGAALTPAQDARAVIDFARAEIARLTAH